MAHGLLNKFAAGLRVRSKVQPRHDVTAQNGLEGRHTYYKTYTLIICTYRVGINYTNDNPALLGGLMKW